MEMVSREFCSASPGDNIAGFIIPTPKLPTPKLSAHAEKFRFVDDPDAQLLGFLQF
jgi:hypothetical protein